MAKFLARSVAVWAVLFAFAVCPLPAAALKGSAGFLAPEPPSSPAATFSTDPSSAGSRGLWLHETGEDFVHYGQQWVRRSGLNALRPSALLALYHRARQGEGTAVLAPEEGAPDGNLESMEIRDLSPLERLSTILFELFFQAIVVFVAAWLYAKHKPDPLFTMDVPDQKETLDGDFKYPLCACLQMPRMTVFTCCCEGIRWADSMRQIGLLTFPSAVLTWLVISAVCIVISIGGPMNLMVSTMVLGTLLTYYRQGLREAFQMETTPATLFGDWLSYVCCGPCALVQDARQVEEAKLLGHEAVSVGFKLQFGYAMQG